MQLQKNSIKKIILGTAQLGLNYGVNKDSYSVSFERAEDILLAAFDLGIETLDTAVGYGKSHEYIKRFHEKYPSKRFKVYSKVSAPDFRSGDLNLHEHLGVSSLEGLMLHTAAEAKDPKLKNQLGQLKLSGTIKSLGLSLYYDPDFKELVEMFKPDFVQVPFNVLDNEKIRTQEFDLLRSKKISVHTRSTLMRGVLTHFKEGSYPQELKPVLESLRIICKDNHISPLSLCLNFSFRKEEIDHVVIGVDTVRDLQECISSLTVPWNSEIDHAISKLVISDPTLMDLRKWQ